MARRTRSREHNVKARRNRPPARWPTVRHRGTAKAISPSGGRVVSLTAARRHAATRRLLEKGRAGPKRGEQSQGPAIDFHLSACVACARAGGRVILDYWAKRRSYPVHEKGRNDFVTIVDRQAEEAIVRIVRERFPDHAILAEESPPREGSVGYRWYVDPLDGTTNFIHGYPLFSVSVAVADPQGMRAAAVFDPLRDEMFTAGRGGGAYLNGKPIHVSPTDQLSQSLLVTGIPFRSLSRLDEYLASFRAFILGASGIRRDGSAALNLAYVACGRLDGFWEMALSPWDIAAGSLIVREAGGIVSDFRGRDGYLESGDILAASPAVHPAMLRTLRDCFRSP